MSGLTRGARSPLRTRGRIAAVALAVVVLGLARVHVIGGAEPATRRAQASSPPAATLLYQNFPNPFPGTGVAAANAMRAAGAPATCIWFDLGRPSRVRLEVYTLAGDLVRVLLPSPELTGVLPADRYGREPGGAERGCDPRLTWNGTGDDGRVVPAGVYLLRLQADGASQVRKVVFRGR